MPQSYANDYFGGFRVVDGAGVAKDTRLEIYDLYTGKQVVDEVTDYSTPLLVMDKADYDKLSLLYPPHTPPSTRI